jgi:hypothetical protein
MEQMYSSAIQNCILCHTHNVNITKKEDKHYRYTSHQTYNNQIITKKRKFKEKALILCKEAYQVFILVLDFQGFT